MTVTFTLNGVEQALMVEPRRTLLDALREDLDLTGTKKVCDMGNCGACTVHLDGSAVYSCLVLAADCEGREVTTIEGIGRGELDPVQRAAARAQRLQGHACKDAHPKIVDHPARSGVARSPWPAPVRC